MGQIRLPAGNAVSALVSGQVQLVAEFQAGRLPGRERGKERNRKTHAIFLPAADRAAAAVRQAAQGKTARVVLGRDNHRQFGEGLAAAVGPGDGLIHNRVLRIVVQDQVKLVVRPVFRLRDGYARIVLGGMGALGDCRRGDSFGRGGQGR